MWHILLTCITPYFTLKKAQNCYEDIQCEFSNWILDTELQFSTSGMLQQSVRGQLVNLTLGRCWIIWCGMTNRAWIPKKKSAEIRGYCQDALSGVGFISLLKYCTLPQHSFLVLSWLFRLTKTSSESLYWLFLISFKCFKCSYVELSCLRPELMF